MIVQAQVAQPQIIQRPSYLDVLLARFGNIAQLGGEAMKGYYYYRNAEDTRTKTLGEAMKHALTLNDNDGAELLRAHGMPEKGVQHFLANKRRLPQIKYEDVVQARDYQKAMIDKNGTNPEATMLDFWANVEGRRQPQGATQSAPAPAPAVTPAQPARSPFNMIDIVKPTTQASYYNPVASTVDFLSSLGAQGLFQDYRG